MHGGILTNAAVWASPAFVNDPWLCPSGHLSRGTGDQGTHEQEVMGEKNQKLVFVRVQEWQHHSNLSYYDDPRGLSVEAIFSMK